MKVVVEVRRGKRGGYHARCPSLPGCRAHGRSRKEALENLDPAIRGYVASLNRPAPRKVGKQVVTQRWDLPRRTQAHVSAAAEAAT